MPIQKTIDLDEIDEALGEDVQDYLIEVANELVNQLKMEAPMGATGDLRRSMQIFFVGENQVVVGSDLHYAPDVQRGTGPHEPDWDKLVIWARRKLGDESAAGPVFTKISEKGTDPNPYLDRAVENTMKRFV